MSTPAPSPLDATPLRGTIRGHALKRILPSAGDDTQSEWKTLAEGETWLEAVPQTSYVAIDSDPFSGDQHVLVVFETGGEMVGPLRFRRAPEHSAGKLLKAARRRQRIQTFAALVAALGWCAGTQFYAVRWMMVDSYGWMVAGLVMAAFAVGQLKMAGRDLLLGVVDLFKTKLPATATVNFTMEVEAETAELKQAA